MKHIEDIEKMSVEELISIAEDMPVEVPDDLDKNISEAIMAQAALADIPKAAQTVRRLILATTAAAACLTVFLTVRNQPKDTFDDPHLAYAELEKTFSYISSKVDKGLEIASEAEPVFTKTAGIFGSNDKQKNTK